jgi:hypothetical protein
MILICLILVLVGVGLYFYFKKVPEQQGRNRKIADDEKVRAWIWNR